MPTAPEEICAALNQSLALHWTAIEFYSSLSAWLAPKYPKLGEQYAADAEEERGHARRLMDRLRYFGEQPEYAHGAPMWSLDQDYIEMLDAAMALESAAATAERSNIAAARELLDEQTAAVFIELLAGSEASLLEIESAQSTIEDIGLDNYLALFA
jgi:bacterioferritin (cytochrome b1)